MVRKAKPAASARPTSDAGAGRAARLKALERVAKRFDGFRPAREVLRRVRAVPTIFPQLDHATGVGGLPIDRFTLLHGPSNEGKSSFALGLVRSFLARDHFALFVDAERTTPIDWVESLVGPELVDHPGFFGRRPNTYEETVEEVRKFVRTLAEAREDGSLPEDASAIVVVDSMRKLVPANLMKKLARDDGGVDGAGGRAAQMKAAMNAAWLDELVPLLDETGTAMVAIARESEDPEADVWAKRAGRDYRVNGGRALIYDSSVVMRVVRAAWVTEGEGPERKTYGERHRVTIRKTKVAGKEEREVVCYFHSSNGVHIPAGFDRARDVIDLGLRLGVLEKRGASISFDGERIGAGEHRAVKALAEDPEWLGRVERAVRAEFEKAPPLEVTGDGEVVDEPGGANNGRAHPEEA